MSLTSQIYDPGSRLGSWCRTRLPGVEAPAARVQAAVEGTVRVRPAGQVGRDHWASVGGIVDARLSSLVQLAAPYGALLGAVRLGALGWGEAELEASSWPAHQARPARDPLAGLSRRPAPGGWVKLPRRATGTPGPGADLAHANLGAFLDRLIEFHAQHAPVGRLADDGAERQLARAYWVISQLEGFYRGGQIDERIPGLLWSTSDDVVVRLLQLAPEEQVNDAVAILAHGRDAGGIDAVRKVAGSPRRGVEWGYAGPVLADRWADGDLLLTPPPVRGVRRLLARGQAPATLVDVKTVMRVDDGDRVARWLWQLAGYAALDAPRRAWRIDRVGLYLARHGVLVVWDLEDLVAQLAGVPRRQAVMVRREMTEQVMGAASLEYGGPPGAVGLPEPVAVPAG